MQSDSFLIKCQSCLTEKTIDAFYKSKKLINGMSVRCKECDKKHSKKHYLKTNDKQIVRSKEYRKNKPDAGRNAKFKYKYGITTDDYDKMLKNQNFQCAICLSNHSNKRMLDVDHNHHTGVVRGLLCRSCNLAIGQLKDSIEILNKAIVYLSQGLK